MFRIVVYVNGGGSVRQSRYAFVTADDSVRPYPFRKCFLPEQPSLWKKSADANRVAAAMRQHYPGFIYDVEHVPQ